jgi:hypothetical protein
MSTLKNKPLPGIGRGDLRVVRDFRNGQPAEWKIEELVAPDGYRVVGEAVTERLAKLFVAAPELLAACEAAARFVAHFPHKQKTNWMFMVEDAIAKAKGGAA